MIDVPRPRLFAVGKMTPEGWEMSLTFRRQPDGTYRRYDMRGEEIPNPRPGYAALYAHLHSCIDCRGPDTPGWTVIELCEAGGELFTRTLQEPP